MKKYKIYYADGEVGVYNGETLDDAFEKFIRDDKVTKLNTTYWAEEIQIFGRLPESRKYQVTVGKLSTTFQDIQ